MCGVITFIDNALPSSKRSEDTISISPCFVAFNAVLRSAAVTWIIGISRRTLTVCKPYQMRFGKVKAAVRIAFFTMSASMHPIGPYTQQVPPYCVLTGVRIGGSESRQSKRAGSTSVSSAELAGTVKPVKQSVQLNTAAVSLRRKDVCFIPIILHFYMISLRIPPKSCIVRFSSL